MIGDIIMERKITITGNGRIKVTPDYINLTLTVAANNKKYEKAVDEVEERVNVLNEALRKIGFGENTSKTTTYRIQPHYKYLNDRKGNTKREFDGYECFHRLKLSFDLNPQKLGAAVGLITKTIANPNLDIEFTVKDKEVAKREALSSTAEDAKLKAEALVAATGEKLGKLISIEHNDWNSLDLSVKVKPLACIEDTCEIAALQTSKIAMEPEDIEVSDSATFIWEIQ